MSTWFDADAIRKSVYFDKKDGLKTNSLDASKGSKIIIEFPRSEETNLRMDSFVLENSPSLKSTATSCNNAGNSITEVGLSDEDVADINSGDYEEYTPSTLATCTNSLKKLGWSDEAIRTLLESMGMTTEADFAKKAEEMNKKMEKLKNTKASNGMSYVEAKRNYMKLYMKYINETAVAVPQILDIKDGESKGEYLGCTFADVDPSKLESFMSKEDLALFEQSKAAMSELKQNKELMDIYKESHTCHLEHNFKFSTALDGSHVRSWEKYAKKNRIDPYSMPYYNPNDPLIWLHKRL